MRDIPLHTTMTTSSEPSASVYAASAPVRSVAQKFQVRRLSSSQVQFGRLTQPLVHFCTTPLADLDLAFQDATEKRRLMISGNMIPAVTAGHAAEGVCDDSAH